MDILTKNTSMTRYHAFRGFSLIEVLIAVVVLSFGLLALASLQISAARTTTEQKDRTAALALAEEKLEQIRSFTSRADSDACGATTSADWPADFRCITPIAEADAEALTDVDGSRGGTNFRRWWTVERYVFDRDPDGDPDTDDGAFVSIADAAATDNAILATSTSYSPGTEVKVVTVNVGWDMPDGTTQVVAVRDIVSSISPNESAQVRSQRSATAQGPKVLYRDPSTEVGVIPIATGSGSETAATNPRPEVVSQGNRTNIIETKFDVLTYAALANDLAAAQARVETSIVGCTCETVASPAAGSVAYRPSYWNGKRYTMPEVAPYGPLGAPVSGVTQSPLCTRCCADHHDPAGVTGAKFDPWRDTHTHYDASGTAVTSGQYKESCRIIRVDGFQHVAADMMSEHFGLIATDNTARSPAPSATAVTNYEAFVLSYLDGRFVSGSSYNTIPGTANTLAAANNLDLPALIGITKPVSGSDPRWLHGRGLYIDYLEQEAQDQIEAAKDGCADSPPTDGCVLPYVPFTAINMTELARWSSSNNSAIQVTNNTGVLFGDPNSPVRGQVTANGAASNGTQANAVALSGKSNTALALVPAIDPDDAVDLEDRQLFQVGATPGTGTKFRVFLESLTFISGNFPVISYIIGSDARDCTAASNASSPNPYQCTTNTNSGGTIFVLASNYNVLGQRNGDNPCTGNKVENNYAVPYCISYDITSATTDAGETGSLVVLNNGRLSEVTAAQFGSLPEDSVVRFTFGTPTTQDATGYTCSGPANKTPTFTLPCQ